MPVSREVYDPLPNGTCRACRSPVNADTWLCVRCGAAHGERNRCPHCHVVARTLPHPTLLHRCSVCGKPRFAPGPIAGALSPVSRTELVRAGHAQRNSTVLDWLGLGLAVAGLFSVLFTALFLWVWSPGFVTAAVFMLLALLPWLFAAYSRFSAKKARKNRDQSLELAYASQLIETLRISGRDETATTIATWLSLSVERTEQLLSRLNADERMTSTVTDDGELVYGVVGPVRARLDTPRMLEESGQGLQEGVRIADDAEWARTRIAETKSPQEIVDAELDELPAEVEKQKKRT